MNFERLVEKARMSGEREDLIEKRTGRKPTSYEKLAASGHVTPEMMQDAYEMGMLDPDVIAALDGLYDDVIKRKP